MDDISITQGSVTSSSIAAPVASNTPSKAAISTTQFGTGPAYSLDLSPQILALQAGGPAPAQHLAVASAYGAAEPYHTAAELEKQGFVYTDHQSALSADPSVGTVQGLKVPKVRQLTGGEPGYHYGVYGPNGFYATLISKPASDDPGTQRFKVINVYR